VVFGNRYYLGDNAGYLNGYRIDTVLDDHVSEFTSNETGWTEFNIPQILMLPGTFFDVVAYVDEPDPTPVSFSGDWNYTTPNNQEVPGPGVIIQSNNTSSSIRVNYLDDAGANRFAELDNLVTGDTITGATTWTILTIVDAGTYFDFGVSPAQQVGPDGVRDFTFTTIYHARR
jgi:hypothetical protein